MKVKVGKYRNFIVVLILSGLIGGVLGGFSDRLSEMNVSFGENTDRFIFGAFLIISLVIAICSAVTLIYIKSKYMKVDLDNVPKLISRRVSNAIHLSTIQLILGLTWDAVVINKNFDRRLIYLIMFPTISIVIAVFLEVTAMKYYNYLYPNRKMNMFENGAEKKFFDKLDDGEKWVTYNCSYATFKKMQIVYTATIVISIVISMFTNVPVILPIVIGILWIIQISIYSFESRKYEDK
jgi:hypothetical protein